MLQPGREVKAIAQPVSGWLQPHEGQAGGHEVHDPAQLVAHRASRDAPGPPQGHRLPHAIFKRGLLVAQKGAVTTTLFGSRNEGSAIVRCEKNYERNRCVFCDPQVLKKAQKVPLTTTDLLDRSPVPALLMGARERLRSKHKQVHNAERRGAELPTAS